MIFKIRLTSIFLLQWIGTLAFAQETTVQGRVISQEGIPLAGAQVYLKGSSIGKACDDAGWFSLKAAKQRDTLVVSFIGHQTSFIPLSDQKVPLKIILKSKDLQLDEVIVSERDVSQAAVSRLKDIEEMAVYAGKKNELIRVSDLTANLATNNARQIFSSVPGLNIWESDRAGLQLGIGGRGLNPNRTSNFNTRQNGYDISADALGYPESYYTPPPEAVDRVELVRGAASLQYGTQFGGMINFKLKEGNPDKKISVESKQTAGSWGLFSSFNSLGGTLGQWNYYTFFQHKQGFGGRPNARFDANIVYLGSKYTVEENLEVAIQYTYMNYLAQQSGGLTDRQFEANPFHSFRERNWFSVDWNLFNLSLDYKFSSRIQIRNSTFGLFAYRKSVGVLTSPTKEDFQPYGPRDYLYGRFANLGNETRGIFKYGDEDTFRGVFLLGMRLYSGNTHKKQGFASEGMGADFSFLSDRRLRSDYKFPSQNIALFGEHVFFLGRGWSITPGIRWEYIETAGQGEYDASTVHPSSGEVLEARLNSESLYRSRSVFLYGLGVSYKSPWDIELYTNFSRNYKAINFNDLRVLNPSAKVDEHIQDESGYNFDMGFRGAPSDVINYDVSFFFLQYGQRIGSIHKQVEDQFLGARLVRFRTNVADASILGMESFAEIGLLSLLGLEQFGVGLRLFSNIAWISGSYGVSKQNGISGNKVELVPDLNIKAGVKVSYEAFKLNYQFSYVGDQYTEASNTAFSSSGSDGLIPAYFVMDLSMTYKWRSFSLDMGINNLSDEVYFTRRAVGYPGPGIIPSDQRNYYCTFSLQI